jgi:hypothetical protein
MGLPNSNINASSTSFARLLARRAILRTNSRLEMVLVLEGESHGERKWFARHKETFDAQKASPRERYI